MTCQRLGVYSQRRQSYSLLGRKEEKNKRKNKAPCSADLPLLLSSPQSAAFSWNLVSAEREAKTGSASPRNFVLSEKSGLGRDRFGRKLGATES